MADSITDVSKITAESSSIQPVQAEKSSEKKKLWDKIREKIPFWKYIAETEPDVVIKTISNVGVAETEANEPSTHQKILSFSNEIKTKYTNGGLPLKDKAELIEVVERAGFEFVGSGRESVVIINPEDDNEVVSIGLRDQSTNQIRKKLLTQGIMSKLFPHNFPEIRVQNEDRLDDELYNPNIVYKSRILSDGKEPTYKFSQVKDDIRELGLPVYFDEQDGINFINGTDRGEYYIDNISTWPDVPWRPELIRQYMEDNEYTQADINFVKLNIDKLLELGMKVEPAVGIVPKQQNHIE